MNEPKKDICALLQDMPLPPKINIYQETLREIKDITEEWHQKNII